jgi:hypothetical protein
VHDLVSAHVAVLRECFETDVAVIRSFASVSSFVCFEVTKLAEPLTAIRFFTQEWLNSSVSSGMDLEMCLLVESLAAPGDVAEVFLSRSIGGERV